MLTFPVTFFGIFRGFCQSNAVLRIFKRKAKAVKHTRPSRPDYLAMHTAFLVQSHCIVNLPKVRKLAQKQAAQAVEVTRHPQQFSPG